MCWGSRIVARTGTRRPRPATWSWRSLGALTSRRPSSLGLGDVPDNAQSGNRLTRVARPRLADGELRRAPTTAFPITRPRHRGLALAACANRSRRTFETWLLDLVDSVGVPLGGRERCMPGELLHLTHGHAGGGELGDERVAPCVPCGGSVAPPPSHAELCHPRAATMPLRCVGRGAAAARRALPRPGPSAPGRARAAARRCARRARAARPRYRHSGGRSRASVSSRAAARRPLARIDSYARGASLDRRWCSGRSGRREDATPSGRERGLD